jgi:hypothetical protein
LKKWVLAPCKFRKFGASVAFFSWLAFLRFVDQKDGRANFSGKMGLKLSFYGIFFAV